MEKCALRAECWINILLVFSIRMVLWLSGWPNKGQYLKFVLLITSSQRLINIWMSLFHHGQDLKIQI